jgi:hypothetical protein
MKIIATIKGKYYPKHEKEVRDDLIVHLESDRMIYVSYEKGGDLMRSKEPSEVMVWLFNNLEI